MQSVKQIYSVQDSNKKGMQFNMSGKLVTKKQNVEMYAPVQYSCYEYFVDLDIYIYCTVTLTVSDLFIIVLAINQLNAQNLLL